MVKIDAKSKIILSWPKEKLWRKVSSEYQMNKKKMILLCQSIIEMRLVSHLYGSALFTVPLMILHKILKTINFFLR